MLPFAFGKSFRRRSEASGCPHPHHCRAPHLGFGHDASSARVLTLAVLCIRPRVFTTRPRLSVGEVAVWIEVIVDIGMDW